MVMNWVRLLELTLYSIAVIFQVSDWSQHDTIQPSHWPKRRAQSYLNFYLEKRINYYIRCNSICRTAHVCLSFCRTLVYWIEIFNFSDIVNYLLKSCLFLSYLLVILFLFSKLLVLVYIYIAPDIFALPFLKLTLKFLKI